MQVQAGRLRRHHQRQHRGVGRDDQVLGEPALQPQSGHAEGAVLVVEMRVHRVVAGFRHAPWHAALLAVLDLPRHRRLGGLVEQRVLVGRHHQLRHQVLEHRAAPRQQDRLAAGGGQQAPQGEPALLRQLSLGDGDEHAQARFRGQQIVVARVPPPLVHVVADAQQVRCLVVQEAVLHVRELAGLQGQALDGRDACPGALAALPRCAGADRPATPPRRAPRSSPAGSRGGPTTPHRAPPGRAASGSHRSRGRRRARRAPPAGRSRARETPAHRAPPGIAGPAPVPTRARRLPGSCLRSSAIASADRVSRSSRRRAAESVAGRESQAASSVLPELGQRQPAAASPAASSSIPRVSRRPSSQRGSRIGRSSSAIRPGRKVSRWPARLPLSTVEM